MFKRRTLFVIGAGASAEVGLPVGTGLARNIREKLKLERTDYGEFSVSDRGLFDQLRRAHPKEVNSYLDAYGKIHAGILLSNSIDDFLHIHRDDKYVVELGKAAIVRAILEAEANSHLYVDQSNIYNIPDYTRIIGTWYIKLLRILGSGTIAPDASKTLDEVAFIIFNYDRCVEHVLEYGLQQLYAINKDEARKIVNAATIIHPYGSIGRIDEVPFGGEKYRSFDCFQLSKRIRTYTEQVEQGEIVSKIQNEVIDADCIIFLGFAFHDQNMLLLHPGGRHEEKEIFGTAFGMSKDDSDNVIEWLSELFPATQHTQSVRLQDNIRLENKLTCTELFESYARSIAG
jgi:hypothetical protein